MSDELEPRPYSDRELTLTAISLTFQRARTVQRELAGTPTWTNPEPPPEPEGATPAEISDADLDDGPDDRPDNAGGRPLGLDTSEEPDLPNPIVTDANLRHYLEQAAQHQGLSDGRRGRLKPLGLNQTLYNAAVVHALHQLDHRTRLQQRTISRLEAELADARRALAALETNELREP